jgi:hypothetical protein
MLDGVCDVDVWPIDPDLTERGIEKLSGWPAQRPSLLVIVLIRLIGNKDDASIGRPLAKDGLRRTPIEFTATARLRRPPQARQTAVRRQKIARRVFRHSLSNHSALSSFNRWRKMNSWPAKFLATLGCL